MENTKILSEIKSELIKETGITDCDTQVYLLSQVTNMPISEIRKELL